MNIKPVASCGSHRTGTLGEITAEEISKKLGFQPNIEDDPDKVVNSWAFTVDGIKCAIWDYKGSHNWGSFSTYGPRETFVKIFGDKVK
jgi:hypothetical protein